MKIRTLDAVSRDVYAVDVYGLVYVRDPDGCRWFVVADEDVPALPVGEVARAMIELHAEPLGRARHSRLARRRSS